jgi:hypothetical protein
VTRASAGESLENIGKVNISILNYLFKIYYEVLLDFFSSELEITEL